MSEDPSSSQDEKNWLEKLIKIFSLSPKDNKDLREILHEAHENQLLDDDVLNIMEGALNVGEKTAREIMIPRTQMTVIQLGETLQEILAKVIDSKHSRFPIIGNNQDEIKGILLAKNLLPLILSGKDEFSLDDYLHPANIIPESKRLNDLLREFRQQRYHMAIVVDEYGNVAGLVTIEDVLEEIVGEIEDETDEEEDERFIRKVSDKDYLIKALTPIEEFNESFSTPLDDTDFDTVGGILVKAFGHVPRRNEITVIDGYKFRILNADSRQIHLARMTVPETPTQDE